ncbi:uncharacterized protein CDV56_102770 [Aspergillus thermomutatus]|uniref:Uncharacterized protein n=1 Tax=Aspergillus thermomutatus TaxID=41047 RepID=A0A397GAA4_ASPTH|nr:uncharacterized protein CDV56_102770 [Aspergillus thermomutatus]RHZ47881.1 hypothetical protein CDV56_102770 [Aspergillus thermomutatus]
MEMMAQEWKLVDTVWDYDVWGYPPACTRLSDAVVFKLLLKNIPKRRSERWPFDFNSRGQTRFEREPQGPTVWIERRGRYYYPEIGGRYVLGGEIARMMDSWFIEPPLYVTRRGSIYFGRVEVPSWAKDQGAIIISSRGVTCLTFDDEDRVSWDGMLGTPIIWAKEVSLEWPARLTRATVVTEVKTESGQLAIMVDYGSDEEPEDTQDSTEIIDVKEENIRIKSEVVSESQGLHLEDGTAAEPLTTTPQQPSAAHSKTPRMLKREPESHVNSHNKRRAEIIDVKKENIRIKSEGGNGSQELHLEDETAPKPLITTTQQPSAAHNKTPRMLKREPESHVTSHNKRRRAISSVLTQGGKTVSWVEMALKMIRQAASANREHQALIRSIREDVKSLQSKVDTLEASAPLPRALEDVRKLMAEHEDDVLGIEEIERTMKIVLQKLPS